MRSATIVAIVGVAMAIVPACDDDGPSGAPPTIAIPLEFAEITIEVCDGLPSYVEDGTVTSDQYCPWSAQVVAVDGAWPGAGRDL